MSNIKGQDQSNPSRSVYIAKYTIPPGMSLGGREIWENMKRKILKRKTKENECKKV
jgi:hypothetical protein